MGALFDSNLFQLSLLGIVAPQAGASNLGLSRYHSVGLTWQAQSVIWASYHRAAEASLASQPTRRAVSQLAAWPTVRGSSSH